MNVVCFTKRRGRVACIDIGWPRLLVLALFGFILLPLALLSVGYWLGQEKLRGQTQALASGWEAELEQQQLTIERALRENQDTVNALALKLGKLQAHAIRVDALGRRLTKMAKLEDGEFDFENPPARGGPVTDAGREPMALDEFPGTMDTLRRQLEDRSQQLVVLETMLMNRRLQEAVHPAGRPVRSGWMSSKFGRRTDPFSGEREFHKGVDFAGKSGSDVIAVAAGVVTWAGEKAGYGKLVEVTHGNGYMTRYGHGREVVVKTGEKVEKGQLLARMGSSGRSTGPHVHFEVIRHGKVVNPSKYIKAGR